MAIGMYSTITRDKPKGHKRHQSNPSRGTLCKHPTCDQFVQWNNHRSSRRAETAPNDNTSRNSKTLGNNCTTPSYHGWGTKFAHCIHYCTQQLLQQSLSKWQQRRPRSPNRWQWQWCTIGFWKVACQLQHHTRWGASESSLDQERLSMSWMTAMYLLNITTWCGTMNPRNSQQGPGKESRMVPNTKALH